MWGGRVGSLLRLRQPHQAHRYDKLGLPEHAESRCRLHASTGENLASSGGNAVGSRVVASTRIVVKAGEFFAVAEGPDRGWSCTHAIRRRGFLATHRAVPRVRSRPRRHPATASCPGTISVCPSRRPTPEDGEGSGRRRHFSDRPSIATTSRRHCHQGLNSGPPMSLVRARERWQSNRHSKDRCASREDPGCGRCFCVPLRALHRHAAAERWSRGRSRPGPGHESRVAGSDDGQWGSMGGGGGARRGRLSRGQPLACSHGGSLRIAHAGVGQQ
jgi:hypothetical protein